MPVKITKSSRSSSTGHIRPTKSRGSSSANISKLNRMNKSLQSSYYQHHDPFRPSGSIKENFSPTSSPLKQRKEEYGFRYRSNPTANSQELPVDSAAAGRASSSRSPDVLRRSGSEYTDKFPEWELPNRERTPSPEQRYSSLHNFNVDFGVSNWESENKRSFQPHYTETTNKVTNYQVQPAAGVPTKRVGKQPSSYTWDGGKYDQQDKENLVNKQASLKSDSKFVWGPSEKNEKPVNQKEENYDLMYEDAGDMGPVTQQVQIQEENIDQPFASADTSFETKPFHRRKTELLSVGDSEYKSSFIKRPIEKSENNGRKSGKKGKEKTKVFVQPDVATDAYHTFRATSEYKDKFPKWEIPEKDTVSNGPKPTALNNYDSSSNVAAWESENHNAFKEHDLEDVQEPVAPIAGISTKALGDPIPPSFAWGGERNESLETPTVRFQPTPTRQRPEPYHTQYPSAYRETLSEYNREYDWPPLEAYESAATRVGKGDRASPDLEKSLQYDVNRSLANAQSEYREQYFDVSRYADFQPSVPNKRVEQNPPQFAWPLVDGEAAKPVSSSPKRKEFSEYTSKYNWPIAGHADPVYPNREPTSGDVNAPVFAVDNVHFDPSKWQSEYDARCADLRQRQKDLSRPIAGVTTKLVDNIPSNFAWPQSRPPAPVPKPTSTADPNHFHTEYLDNFLRWRVDGQQPPLAKPNQDQLNLFIEDNSSPGVNKQPSTEYKEKFKPVFGASDEVQFKKPSGGDSAPPQFAWPLVDKPLPSPPPIRSKSATPFTKTEYKTNFAWPPQPPPITVKKPEDHYPLYGVDDDNKDSAKWNSEYDDNAKDAKKLLTLTPTPVPVGLVSIPSDHVPSFFAWADEEAKKIRKPSAVKVYHNVEKLETETHEAFRRSKDIIPVPPEKFHEEDTLNLFQSTKEEAEKFPKTFETEYDSNFRKSSVTSIPSQSSALQRADLERPPQFAWPLLNQTEEESNKRPVTPSNTPHIPFTETSEYDSKFTWKGESPRPRSAVKSRDEYRPNLITPWRKQEDESTKDWQSEYDDRCVELRRRQQDLASVEESKRNPLPVAGVKTPSNDQPPNFYVWSALDAPPSLETKPPRTKSSEDGPPEVTEYTDQFQPYKADLLNISSKMLANSHRFENTKEHIFSNNHQFQGRTEYSDNFTTVNSFDSTVPIHLLQNREVLQNHQQVKHGQTLRYTNLDRTYKDPVKKIPDSPPRRVEDIKKIKQTYTTEYQDHFEWPEKLHATTPSPSVSLQTPEAARNVRATAPGVINPINEAMRSFKDSPRALSELTVPKEETAKRLMTLAGKTPLTETQEKFAWPSDAPKIQLDATAKAKVAKSKKASKKHYHSYLSASTPALLSPGSKRPWNYAKPAAPRAQPSTTSPTTPPAEEGKKKKYHVMSKNGEGGNASSGNQVVISSPTSVDYYSYAGSPTSYDEADDRPIGTRFQEADTFHSDEARYREDDSQSGRGQSTTIRTTTTGGTTFLSQDSLNFVPSTNTVGTANTTTTSASLNNTTARPRSAVTADDTTISTLGATNLNQTQDNFKRTLTVPLNQVNDEWKVNYIPAGLRSVDQYRSRSAPPRRTISSEFDHTIKPKMYVDESSSNPVLINRRYPEISDRQSTRWSTETKDSYRWKAH